MSLQSTNITNSPTREYSGFYVEYMRQLKQIMLYFTVWLHQKQQIFLHLNYDTFKWHIQSFNLHVKLGLGKVICLYSYFFIPPSSLITPPCPFFLKYEPLPAARPPPVNLNQLDTCAFSEMTSAALWQCCSQPLISVCWKLFTAVSSFTSH